MDYIVRLNTTSLCTNVFETSDRKIGFKKFNEIVTLLKEKGVKLELLETSDNFSKILDRHNFDN